MPPPYTLGYGGERGKSWLQDLPHLVAAAGQRWCLEEPRPLPGLRAFRLLRRL